MEIGDSCFVGKCHRQSLYSTQEQMLNDAFGESVEQRMTMDDLGVHAIETLKP
jgi:hypothetical protein